MNKYRHLTPTSETKNVTIRSMSRTSFKNETSILVGPYGIPYEIEPKEKPIHYPIRPNTALISSLTIQENLKRKINFASHLESRLSKTMQYSFSEKDFQTEPKPKDFTSMIKKLDRISRNINYGQKNLFLKPSEPLDIELLSNESQIVTINTRRKPTPLHVYIDRSFGKLEIYVSKKIKDPSKTVHDLSFTKDYFRISETTLLFTYPFICINFTAIKESKFSVSIRFGPTGMRVQRSKKHYDDFIDTIYNEEDLEDSIDEKLKVPERKIKDFINANKSWVSKLNNSQSMVLERKKSNDLRINRVLEKRKIILQENYEKKLFIKDRKEMRAQAEIKAQEISVVLSRKQTFEKIWLTFTYFSASAIELEWRLREKTNQIRRSEIRNNAAKLIQSYARKKLHIDSIQENNMSRAWCSLLLFKIFCKPPYLAKSKIQILTLMKENAKNLRLPTKFQDYSKKGIIYIAIIIQEAFRAYKAKIKRDLEELENLWTKEVKRKIEVLTKTKRKKKKAMIGKYMSIPTELRDKILFDYYYESKKNFKNELCSYMHFINLNNLKYGEKNPPVFRYIPSEDDLKDLITSALNSLEVKPKS